MVGTRAPSPVSAPPVPGSQVFSFLQHQTTGISPGGCEQGTSVKALGAWPGASTGTPTGAQLIGCLLAVGVGCGQEDQSEPRSRTPQTGADRGNLMGPRGGKCYRWTLEAFGDAISEHVGEAGLQGEVTIPYVIKGRGVCGGEGI